MEIACDLPLFVHRAFLPPVDNGCLLVGSNASLKYVVVSVVHQEELCPMMLQVKGLNWYPDRLARFPAAPAPSLPLDPLMLSEDVASH